MTPTTYKGWSVSYDPGAYTSDTQFVADHPHYDTPITAASETVVRGLIDAEEADVAETLFDHARFVAANRTSITDEWNKLPTCRADEARIAVERGRA
jgi:hypothetical protein